MKAALTFSFCRIWCLFWCRLKRLLCTNTIIKILLLSPSYPSPELPLSPQGSLGWQQHLGSQPEDWKLGLMDTYLYILLQVIQSWHEKVARRLLFFLIFNPSPPSPTHPPTPQMFFKGMFMCLLFWKQIQKVCDLSSLAGAAMEQEQKRSRRRGRTRSFMLQKATL